MATTFLNTKMYWARRQANFVARARLLEKLDRGWQAGHALTLISAPAGYGKTTLLHEWLSTRNEGGRMKAEGKPPPELGVHPSSPEGDEGGGMKAEGGRAEGPLQRMKDPGSPSENEEARDQGLFHPSSFILPPSKVAWLTLDKADDDPTRFWACTILSLQALHDELGETSLAQLRSPQPPPVPQILPSLLNDIDALRGRGILVLDDYHAIASPEVHDSVSYFLENLPPSLHVVISTRSDPPIPIARLRSRGQVVEIRTDDLRFTPDEAAAFLNQTMGLALSSEQVAALDERTEGWIAGLQMAALSMRGRDDVDSFIRAFAGTHRFIMDYLLEEVLAREPEEVQTFLLHTCILNRLTGPLCDAITGASGGQERLERLERRNLFVVPLDDERRWYRYHHLFADLLQAQLHKSLGEAGVAALHLRASEWYEQNGLTMEAIHHASLASDFQRIERLIEKNYLEMMNRGEMSSIRVWMGRLSPEMVSRRPWLCLYEAFSRSWFGQLEEADALLDRAEERIRSEAAAPDTRARLGYHAYVKSRVTAMQGNTHRAIELCLAARENIPAGNLGLQIEVGVTLGYEYFLYGDFVNARKTLHEMIQSGYSVRAINNPVAAYALLARSLIVEGRLHAADELYQKAAQWIHETDGQHLGAIGLVQVGRAALQCEWNDLPSALAGIQQGIDFLPWWGKADDLALAHVTLARIQLAQGHRTEAAAAMEQAAQLIQTCGVFSEARVQVEAAQVRMWLLQGDSSAIERWAACLDKRWGSPDPFRYEDELTHVTQARVFIALNKPEQAIRLLSRLEESAQAGGRMGRLVEIRMLQALALQTVGDTRQADTALTTSLTLAEPEGYLRLFVDEGEPMRLLLSDLASRTERRELAEYAKRLLAAFGQDEGGTRKDEKGQDSVQPSAFIPQRGPSALHPLVEPLTPRELEVLRLICAGDSNQAIADKLVITVSAVKKHTGNILGKLGVTSRAQAMVKARELGLGGT